MHADLALLEDGAVRQRGTRTHCAEWGDQVNATNCYQHPRGGCRTRCKGGEADRRHEQRARLQLVREAKLPLVCDICGAIDTPTRGKRTLRPVPDHDPEDGRRRCILCLSCRSGVRALGDDPARLRRAATYLEGGLAPQ